MAKTLSSKAFKGFLWLSGSSGIESILQVGILAILARFITPEDFGLAQIALIIVGFAKLVSQMGVGPALVQIKHLTIFHERAAFYISLIFGGSLTLLTIILSPYIAGFFSMPDLERIIVVISYLFIIESFVVVSRSLIQRDMNLKYYSIIKSTSYLVGYGIVGVTLAILNFGVWALIFAIISQTVCMALFYSIYKPVSYIPIFKLYHTIDLLKFGGGYTLAKFFNYFAGQGDNIVIGKTLTADLLGIYSRAYAIIVKPVHLIASSLDKAIFPAMASIQDDHKKLKKSYIDCLSSLNFISLPIAFIMIYFAEEIVLLLLGQNWLDAIVPLQILAIGMIFKMGYKISDSLIRATGKVYETALRQFIFATMVIVFTLFGSQYGINGVSVGIITSLLLHNVIMLMLSKKIIKFKWTDVFYTYTQGLLNLLIVIILIPIIFNLFTMFGIMNIISMFMTLILTGITMIFMYYKYNIVINENYITKLISTYARKN